jgi:two-component system, sensor histidine kinase
VMREPEEVLNRPLLDVLPELRGQGFEPLMARVYDTGEPYVGK